MESKHQAEFNHDPWAVDYDRNVQNEAHPIRTGYRAVLRWVVANAGIDRHSVVVDLGAGTGNTSALIAAAERVVCVDVSTKMMELARPKLAHLPRVDYVQADLLGYFHRHNPSFDALISTYAVHHLTDEEKADLFRLVAAGLRPGGRAVFGDLMFADRQAEQTIADRYAAVGDVDMVETFAEEFFWYVDTAEAALANAGLRVLETHRFSELSWAICAEKPLNPGAIVG